MRPTNLIGSLRGVERDVRREILNSFGPRETSSGNNPTCCLRLDLIMALMVLPVNRLFVSNPRNLSACLNSKNLSTCCLSKACSLWGALPLLIYVEGAGLHD